MKIQITKTVTDIEEIEIEFPIYCHEQREEESGLDYSVYTRINKDSFYQIIWKLTGITFASWKTNNLILSSHWLENRCDKKEWEDIVNDVVKSIQKFEI